MIWIAHSVFLIVFVIFAFAKTLKEQTREEFVVLPAYEKDKIYKRPWTFIVLAICFLIMDCIVRTLKGGEFLKILGADLIPTLLFIWMLLLQTKKGCKIKKLRWLPYAVFFVFTLIRNITGHERVIGIVLTEIRSLALLGAFALVCLVVLANPDELPTMEEKAKNDADYKQRQDERQQRQYEKQLREEQKRIREEEAARTHEAYERIVLGKKTSGSSYGSSYSSSDSYGSYTDKRERVAAASYDSCDNCRYYVGDYCTCRESLSYNSYILSPRASVCGYHRS